MHCVWCDGDCSSWKTAGKWVTFIPKSLYARILTEPDRAFIKDRTIVLYFRRGGGTSRYKLRLLARKALRKGGFNYMACSFR